MISYDNLVQFGKIEGTELKIKTSFSVSRFSKQTTECMVVRALAYFVGENAPKIQFTLTADGQDAPFYESHQYRIGKINEYTRQSWRIPPLFLPNMTLSVHINIPEGTVLVLKDFGTSANVGEKDWYQGIRHNAHLGFWGLAPDNTMPAFELAAACNFPSCIVVPKVTKDGVLVCIHDDTINRTARDFKGNAPSEPLRVDEMTYEELLKWEYGSYKNEIYKGTKIPLLAEFFDLCAKTGMRPMFSTHPGLTVEQWKQVREMLEKRGLLKNFHIKSFGMNILECAFSVFGTDIDGYTYDKREWEDSIVDALKNIGIDGKKCRFGIELQFDNYTKEIAEKITSAGFFASAWGINRRDFDAYERLISFGVTEFTEDYHCSMGLNY